MNPPDLEPSDGGSATDDVSVRRPGERAVTVRLSEGRRVAGRTVWVSPGSRDIVWDMLRELEQTAGGTAPGTSWPEGVPPAGKEP